ncbi:MAG: DUF1858 domain-containing protein [Oscillospiraceae bacterium]|nr:DUF1858 domain-containing protein [Oscillospiraceae bacterium]
MTEFNKDTLIGEVLAKAPYAQGLFMSIGMHCLGCGMSAMETIEEACDVHGVESDIFVEVLNRYVRDYEEGRPAEE